MIPKFFCWRNHYDECENIEGRVIRVRRKADGQYFYGLADGGFGCDALSMGNAIFVAFVGKTYRDHQNLRALDIRNVERWEKYWPIEVMEVQ